MRSSLTSDSAPRDKVLNILAEIGVPLSILCLHSSILKENKIIIDDGIVEHPAIHQTTELAQGDNLSPLLFSILLKALPKRIKGARNMVNVLLYADGLVVYGTSRFHVQQALARLHQAVNNLVLSINLGKTEAMKFRRGGRVSERDTLHLPGSPLAYVNRFTYLGLTVSVNGRSFTAHVAEICRKALLATYSISDQNHN